MFCSKCGSQNDDSAMFCLKCGEGLSKEATVPVVEMKLKKKKSKKLPIILGAVALVVIVIIIAMNSGDEIDYVATAKAYQPFAQSQNLPGTCGRVLDKYLDGPKWSATLIEETAYVTVSGTLKGATDKISITIIITPSKTKDTAIFDFAQASINGNQTTDANDVAELMLAFFAAYNDGQEYFDSDLYL